ncbi:bifunctional 4-hydroxy-2-oxoglutarate aldolase/2-dehydro-3-deoxy-phosphogluconate aldolase, partial [Nocardiopsis dassonvillei]
MAGRSGRSEGDGGGGGIGAVLALSPVVPVVTVDSPGRAVPLAEALLAGGVGVVEVTLRTPGALEAVRAIAEDVPDMVVGAGTVLTPRQADEAAEAGARFLVTPGTTDRMLRHLVAIGVPALPGVATVSEVLAAREAGMLAQKLFPASVPGIPFLRSVAGPVPDVVFCPTGGITAATAADYLALDNVACVGGSWLTPGDAVRTGDWARITGLAAAAVRLGAGAVGDGRPGSAPPHVGPGPTGGLLYTS